MKFGSSLRSSKVHFRIHKPVCKQRLWLAPELNEANQMLSLQTGLRILKWTFELRNELPNFATKFGILQWKVTWNRLKSRLFSFKFAICCYPLTPYFFIFINIPWPITFSIKFSVHCLISPFAQPKTHKLQQVCWHLAITCHKAISGYVRLGQLVDDKSAASS